MAKKSADWRKTRLEEIRALIFEADPDAIEEQKYKIPSRPEGVPVWYHDGMICTGETYKKHLRLTFSKGARLREDCDPKGVFNKHSAIVIEESDKIDKTAFKNIIKAAVKLNQEKK